MKRTSLKPRRELLLVCSSGGHLMQLVTLRDAWKDFDREWVSFDKSDVHSLLRDERVNIGHGPTNRSVTNLIRNLALAWRLIRKLRPRVLVTTGAGIAVPFAWVARLYGSRIIYIESFTRIDSVSLSCRLIQPVADHVYVQWPEAKPLVRRARYVGSLFREGLRQ